MQCGGPGSPQSDDECGGLGEGDASQALDLGAPVLLEPVRMPSQPRRAAQVPPWKGSTVEYPVRERSTAEEQLRSRASQVSDSCGKLIPTVLKPLST